MSFSLKSDLSLIVHSQNSVELRSGVFNQRSYYIDDENKENILATVMLELFDGAQIKSIVEKHGIKKSQILGLIDHLYSIGVADDDQPSFLKNHLEKNCFNFMRNLENKTDRVVIVSGSELSSRINIKLEETLPAKSITSVTKEFLSHLIENNETSETMSRDLYILAFDYIDPNFTLKFNRYAIKHNINWMFGAIDGPFVVVGPTILAEKKSPCFECFEERVGLNLRDYEQYRKFKLANARNMISNPKNQNNYNLPMIDLASSLIQLEILNYLATGTSFSVGKVNTIYLPTMETKFHKILKYAACSSCGSHQESSESQLYFDFHKIVEASL